MKGSLRSCSTGLRVRVGFEGCRLFRSFELIRFALTPNNLPFLRTYKEIIMGNGKQEGFIGSR